MIGIIDYGMGNIQSVLNAFERLKSQAEIITTPDRLAACSSVVLPGVGAFSKAMDNLRKMKIIDPLKEKVAEGHPFLGICLGMQLLADASEEHGLHEGLGLIPGRVRMIPAQANLRLPHIGWNEVKLSKPGGMFSGVSDHSAFYFVHSFRMECDAEYIAAVTEYGGDVTAAVQLKSIFGVQFHPEKSQANGLRLLKNFIEYDAAFEAKAHA